MDPLKTPPVRVDWRPHPITDAGRIAVVAPPGVTLAEALDGHIPPGVPAVATVNGALLGREAWDACILQEGDIVSARAAVEGGGGGSNPIAALLSIAVIIAAPYVAGAILGVSASAVGGTIGGALLTGAIQLGGILLVNTLFPPRLPPAPSAGPGQPAPQYTLAAGANRARPYEPLLLVLGTHRVFPDLVAREYADYGPGSAQYLNQIFDFGLGNLAVGTVRLGETPLTDFSDVSIQSRFLQRQAPAPTASASLGAPAVSGDVETRQRGGRGGGTVNVHVVRWTAVDGASAYEISVNGGNWRRAPRSRMATYAVQSSAERTYRVRAVAGATRGLVSNAFALPSQTSTPAPRTTPPAHQAQPALSDVADPQLSRVTLVHGNVDTIQGGDLELGVPLSRTTAGDTTAIAFDLVVQHFRIADDNDLEGRETRIRLEWRPQGTAAAWEEREVAIVTPSGAEARNPTRVSYWYETGAAESWETRTTLLTEHDEDDNRLTFSARIATIRAAQDDEADFTGRNPLAIRAKATGQLYGRMDKVNAVCSQLIDSWDGARWVPGQATSNPGDILLAFLRGWRIDGRLAAGFGLPDDRIDFDSIQAFAEHCTTLGLTCDMVLDGSQGGRVATARTICQCGWGRLDPQAGGYGVVFENADEPLSGVITPANVIANTLKVTYDHEGLADEIVGDFQDEAADYAVNSLRRTVPGVDLPERSVTLPLAGIVRGRQAAMEINRAVAAQAFHRRAIGWEMTERQAVALSIGDVVGASHGLIGAGAGGRLAAISADRRTLTFTREVDEAGICWIWDLNDEVLTRNYTVRGGMTLRLDEALPAPPAGVEDEPASYQVMCFPEASDLVRLRIVAKTPSGRRMRFTARDEVARYYEHRTDDLSWSPLDAPGDPDLTDVPVDWLNVQVDNLGVRVFTWLRHPSPSVDGYELRYGPPGTDWDAMLALHEGLVTSSPLELVDRPDPGSWRFAICAVLASGRRTPPRYATARLGHLPRTGADFEEIEIYQVRGINDGPAERPGAVGSYDFLARELTPPEGWTGPAFPAYTPEQVVWASTTTADRGEGNLWEADEDDWSDPVVVGDADDLNLAYARLETPPTEAPAPSPGIPEGWHDLVQDVPAGPDPIYVIIGVRRRGSANYVWQLPTQLEGQDAVSRRELTAYRVQSVTDRPPANPGARGTYRFSTDAFTPPAGWVYPWPGRTQGQAVWAITATASNEAADRSRQDLWTADRNDWIGPVLVSDEGAINIIYRRSVGRPAEPANSNGVPANWYDRVSSVPAGQGRIWVSIGVRVRGASQFNWGAPTLLEGRGIISATRDPATGIVTLRYDDGTVDTFTVVNGEDGSSITASFSTDDEGDVTVTFSDGTMFTIRAGQAGRGIRSITRNASTGVVTVAYDDGSDSAHFTVRDGEDGVGITQVDRSSTGLVTITYTDGSRDSFTVRDGEDGRSIDIASTRTLTGGGLRITFNDGTFITIPPGTAGADGRGIRSIVRNSSTGVVTVTYDDGTTQTFTVRDGEDGDPVSRADLVDQITILLQYGISQTPTVSTWLPGAAPAWGARASYTAIVVRNDLLALPDGPNGETRYQLRLRTVYTRSTESPGGMDDTGMGMGG